MNSSPIITPQEVDKFSAAVIGSILLEPSLLGCGINCLDFCLANEYANEPLDKPNSSYQWFAPRDHALVMWAIQSVAKEGQPINEASVSAMLESWGDSDYGTITKEQRNQFVAWRSRDDLGGYKARGEGKHQCFQLSLDGYCNSVRRFAVDPEFNDHVEAIGRTANCKRDIIGFDPAAYEEYQGDEPKGYRFRLDPTPFLALLSEQKSDINFESISLPGVTISPQRDYIVPGILVRGEPCLATGREKTGKTTTMLDQAISIATGTPWLGNFPVWEKGPVVFASAESGEKTLIDAAARIAKGRSLSLSNLGDLHIVPRVPRFNDKGEVAAFERKMRAINPKVVYFDPSSMCLSPAAATTASVAYQELGAITEACKRCDATLVLVSHTTKSPGRGFDFRSVAGAGIGAWARQWITLEPTSQFKPKTGEHRLRMSVGGSAGHAGEWKLSILEGNQADPGGRVWDVAVEDVETPTERDARVSKTVVANAAKLAAAVEDIGKPATKTKLSQEAGMSRSSADNALAHLISSGQIERTTSGKGKSQKTLYTKRQTN